MSASSSAAELDGVPTQDSVGRVLSVDDDAGAARSVARVLMRSGYQVDCAHDAREALALLGDSHYDVVITDLAMPDMDGAALIREGLGIRPSTVYVVVTGRDDAHAWLVHTPERSVLGVLRKPWEASELLDMVGRAKDVSRHKTSAPAAIKTLLLVEDSDAHAELVRAYLDEVPTPYAITRATTLDEAVRLARLHAFDVVLTDLNLPDARGLDAVRRLLEAASVTPLVAMSHSLDPDIGAQGLELGACDFLPKAELTPASLARVLAHAVMRRRASQRLEALAFRDALTGLSNARHLRDRLQAAVARAVRQHSECAVVFLDLDGFKPVNDQYGHAAGDHVLRTVARRMDAELRSADTLARLGGDEFAILLEDVGSVVDLERVVERLLAAVASPIEGALGVCSVTGSAGIARCPSDGDTPDAVLRAADRAMYQAKRRGKNGYAFAHAPSARPPALEPERREAARARLRYVPIVSAAADAALAWDVVMLGATGRLSEVDVERASGRPGPALSAFAHDVSAALCRHTRLLGVDPGLPASISLSVASPLLRCADFPETVASALAFFGLAPGSLELFISDQVALDDDCEGGLARLLDLGFHLSLRLGHAEASIASIARRPYRRLRVSARLAGARPGAGRDDLSTIVALAQRLGMAALGDDLSEALDVPRMLALGCGALTGPLFGGIDAELVGPGEPSHELAARLGRAAQDTLRDSARG